MGVGMTALVRSAEGSSAVINAVYLPMAILSGTFFTTEAYPPFLHAIADVLPLTHFTEVTRDVMVRNEHVWENLGSLSVVARLGRRRPRGRDPRLPLAAAREPLAAVRPRHVRLAEVGDDPLDLRLHVPREVAGRVGVDRRRRA